MWYATVAREEGRLCGQLVMNKFAAMSQGQESHHFWNPAAASASGGKSLAFKSAVMLTTTFTALAVVSLVVEPLYGDYLVDAWAS